VIGEHGSHTKRCFERFLEKKHLEPLEWQGARIPSIAAGSVRRQIGNGEVLSGGDALRSQISNRRRISPVFAARSRLRRRSCQNGKATSSSCDVNCEHC